MTFTTPHGVKLRCTSKRRFYVTQEWSQKGTLTAHVVLRTDSLERARKEKSRGKGLAIFDSSAKAYIPSSVNTFIPGN